VIGDLLAHLILFTDRYSLITSAALSCPHRFNVHGNQRFTLVFIRANPECDVPRRCRQLNRSAIEIHRAPMAIALSQTKDEMLFVQHTRRCDWLDFTCKKQRLGIAVSKRLQHFMPTQEIDVDVRKRQFVVQSEAGLQGVFGKKFARGAAKRFGKTIEIFLAQRQSRSHFTGRVSGSSVQLYDAGERRLTLANAGSPYPVLLRDGEVQQIRLAGVPLGLFPDTEYDEVTVALRPGDVVLFASDGILESEDSEQVEFGIARLSALLKSVSPHQPASEICDLVLNATDSYTGGGFAPADDRTLLVLRLTDHTSSDFSKMPIIY